MLKILGRKNSSNVQKVLWCCAELGLDFKREDVGGQFGKNREPEYLALNPNGLIPTVIDDDFVLWESNTIIRYLATKHGDETFYPADTQTRANGEKWMDWQLSVVAPTIWPVFAGLIRTPPEERDHTVIANARDKLADTMKILDNALGRTDFVAGSSLSVGDIPVGIMTYRWFTLDIEREDMPNLERWYDRLMRRPGFQEHVMIGLS
ncbi:MAG: glutathione S-transferase family protein [Gammaproteobacteria bacterium]|nr:glutathione S-transferase family protein [Gammaproteobacteria bacterium]